MSITIALVDVLEQNGIMGRPHVSLTCENCLLDYLRLTDRAAESRFCSRGCMNSFHAQRRRGQSNPNWNGGKEGHTERTREWKHRYPNRVKAHDMVANEVKQGRMTRLPCEVCGIKRTHGHHEDYSKPLDVRWLCPGCHIAEHRKAS